MREVSPEILQMAIERMRRRLFARYVAEDMHIIPGSEEVRLGGSYQSLGGLSYKIDSPCSMQLSIQHENKDEFAVHLSRESLNTGVRYTEFAFTARAHELSRLVRGAIIDALYGEI